MHRVFRFSAVKIILSFIGLLFLVLIGVSFIAAPKPKQLLLGAQWSLEELEKLFIGNFPKNATDVQYQSLANYALLSFSSPPSDALEFAKRFCYGSLIEGYDPFSSIDSNNLSDDILIQTNPDYFYYSHSINNLNPQMGNRCSDLRRGGLHQIVVYKNDDNLYQVKLEISATCNNQNAPHPCEGIAVSYTNHGAMKIGQFYSFKSKYAEGDSWGIPLESKRQYKLIIKPKEGQQSQNQSDFQALITPVLASDNETYCEACWVNTRGSSQEILEAIFLGPVSGMSKVKLFWMGLENIYEIGIFENI